MDDAMTVRPTPMSRRGRRAADAEPVAAPLERDAADPAPRSTRRSRTRSSRSIALSLWYGEQAGAARTSRCSIPEKQITAFIGPSGCGKSTLLRCFNRLNDLIDGVRIEGDIRFEGAASTTRGST